MDWVLFVAMVLAVVSGIFLFKKKGEPFPQKLTREYYVLFVVGVIVSVILYLAYLIYGQAQGGYVAALSCFFGVLVTCIIGRLLLAKSHVDRKSAIGKTLLATGLALLGFILVYGFFSVWNVDSTVPRLLFGYAFGVSLIGFLTSARLGLSSIEQNELQVVRLMEYVAVLSAVLCAGLVINPSFWTLRAAGILVVAVLLTLVLSKEYFSLRSALLACVIGAIGVIVFGHAGRWPVLVGVVGFFVMTVLALYFSSNKYRVVRAVQRLAKEIPFAQVWTFEGVFALALLVVLLVFISYSLGIRSSLSGWAGVALSGVGLVALGPYVLSRFDGERIKGVFLAVVSSLAVLLLFGVFQAEVARVASASLNLAKVEVFVAVLLGVLFVALWMFFSARTFASARKLDGAAERLGMIARKSLGSIVLCGICVALVALFLRGQGLAGLLAGLFAGGFVFSLWALFTGAAIGDVWRERSGIPSLMLFAALLALVLAPLVV